MAGNDPITDNVAPIRAQEPELLLSPYSSAMAIVTATCSWLLRSPDAPKEIGGVHSIYTVQALPYFTGITLSPWSLAYPTAAAVVQIIHEKVGLRVRTTDGGPWR